MAGSWITARKRAILFAITCLAALSLFSQSLSAYHYHASGELRATVASARRILAANNGVFVGPDEVQARFNTSARLPYRIPFTERDLLECGRCVLFPTVSHIGYRRADTSINSLWRSPEVTRLFRRPRSLLYPWFRDQSFARRPLSTRWHLVRLQVEAKGLPARRQRFYRDQERPPAANTALWLLLLLPPELFKGEYFFTSETIHRGRNVVIVGRPQPDVIDITYLPLEVARRDTGRLVEILPKGERDRNHLH